MVLTISGVTNYDKSYVNSLILCKNGVKYTLSNGQQALFKKQNSDMFDMAWVDIRVCAINGIEIFPFPIGDDIRDDFIKSVIWGSDMIVNCTDDMPDDYIFDILVIDGFGYKIKVTEK